MTGKVVSTTAGRLNVSRKKLASQATLNDQLFIRCTLSKINFQPSYPTFKEEKGAGDYATESVFLVHCPCITA